LGALKPNSTEKGEDFDIKIKKMSKSQNLGAVEKLMTNMTLDI
jgi:hypothetical protein